MADFQFLQNPISKKWVILAPRRSKRPHAAEASRGEPDVAKGAEPICPFCIGREKDEQEVYRVGGQTGDHKNLQTALSYTSRQRTSLHFS
ncbi:MAG: hypothetical protein HYU49_01575 [Candidatus Levybacteria bacterium]|nr:hypothetical protein [Candidatus Levybacteria bacterium]